ncbi:hypothetical protein DF121_10840 [Burkholderia stagnalis]|nr:hypothetical protein DF145_09570 [Burkholderia stagnalis]RQY02474.1 hypothetical protein DF121_10840 [Burkholderia stagnalis]RQY19877.1 hypothetical protein DF115_10665 [Burkholderia stagnalis]RQY31067.1 hypothetical protein DF114_14735 [Burkholderia stagnalis]
MAHSAIRDDTGRIDRFFEVNHATRVCLHMERTREARDAANTGRIRKERNAASGRSRGNPKL